MRPVPLEARFRNFRQRVEAVKRKSILLAEEKASNGMNKECRIRAKRIVAYLKKAYPKPKSELKWETPFQFVVAVILSAQCTDKVVNRVTEKLFRKYKTPQDFARATQQTLEMEISSIPFFAIRQDT